MGIEEAVDSALRFVEHINRGKLDELSRLMTEDHEFMDLAGDVTAGRERMTQGWSDYMAMCPDYMIHISDLFVAGEEVIMVGRTTGSHLNQVRYVEFKETLIWVAKVNGRKVAAWRLYYDTEETRERLGANEQTRVTVRGSMLD